LQGASSGLRERAYRRLAALWDAGLDRPNEQIAVELFRWLVAEEAAAGTSAKAVLNQLPREMAKEIWSELRVLLEIEEEPDCGERARAGM
jgi:hypothetical protein